MHLQLYIYNCQKCGNFFKSPELPGNPYGEFLMRSKSGEIVYLSTSENLEFQEVKNFFEQSSLLKSHDKMSRAKIFHKIFGVVCDPASDNSEYLIGRTPVCSQCHLNDKLTWHSTNPPEMVDLYIKKVTYNKWNKLSDEEKSNLLNNAIKTYLKCNLKRSKYML